MFALLGIGLVAPLSKGSTFKGLAAGGIGLMLSTIGLDSLGATPRLTFGQLFLWDGVGAIPLALGLFAIPEIVEMAATSGDPGKVPPRGGGSLWSGVRDVGRLWRLVLRSSAIGTIVGFLPGVGASVSQWIAYAAAARHSPARMEFGEGAIEGVIAPSAANNATLGRRARADVGPRDPRKPDERHAAERARCEGAGAGTAAVDARRPGRSADAGLFARVVHGDRERLRSGAVVLCHPAADPRRSCSCRPSGAFSHSPGVRWRVRGAAR